MTRKRAIEKELSSIGMRCFSNLLLSLFSNINTLRNFGFVVFYCAYHHTLSACGGSVNYYDKGGIRWFNEPIKENTGECKSLENDCFKKGCGYSYIWIANGECKECKRYNIPAHFSIKTEGVNLFSLFSDRKSNTVYITISTSREEKKWKILDIHVTEGKLDLGDKSKEESLLKLEVPLIHQLEKIGECIANDLPSYLKIIKNLSFGIVMSLTSSEDERKRLYSRFKSGEDGIDAYDFLRKVKRGRMW